MASTGEPDRLRRGLLKALAAAPAAALAPVAMAIDYTSAAEVFAAIDRAEVAVGARLMAIVALVPQARPFADSVLADHARHRAARGRLRERLGAPALSRVEAPSVGPDLAGLRTAQQDLVHAHAEGLPALGDALAVDVLARNMVDLARQLTVIDLWIEGQDA